LEGRFRAFVVWLVLNGNVEKALELLAQHYNVSVPRVKVGLPKGHRRKAFGCYTAKNETISVLDSDALKQPSVILHEFYHHLRTSVDKKHRGTEKRAGRFVREFVDAYRSVVGEVSGS
jgi:hypothetical protein